MPAYRIHLVTHSGGKPDCLWVLKGEARGRCIQIVRDPEKGYRLDTSYLAYATEIPYYFEHEYYESISFEDYDKFMVLLNGLVAELKQNKNTNQQIPVDYVTKTVKDFFEKRDPLHITPQ
ncbi:hypothetical protein VHEMI07475 [[Torrubiella] hemipterigena]|uniref:Uncharacterized protein n=1 Tax=[Torrubiella] hemipterigena TaxID=1531966 RepID=A0A0A1TLS0_9HYPO|nr:hypothetical protein VHEMI07475 [[Torrubiella] hemipterigena]